MEKTFAPRSAYTRPEEIIKPSKGPVIEVLVTWGERILQTRHFMRRGFVSIGAHRDCDIILPYLKESSRYALLNIAEGALFALSDSLEGELIGPESRTALKELYRQGHRILNLPQGQMIRLPLMGGALSVFVRYVADSPKAEPPPIVEFSVAEMVAMNIASLLPLLLSQFTVTRVPDPPAEKKLRAAIQFSAPKLLKRIEIAKSIEKLRQPKRGSGPQNFLDILKQHGVQTQKILGQASDLNEMARLIPKGIEAKSNEPGLGKTMGGTGPESVKLAGGLGTRGRTSGDLKYGDSGSLGERNGSRLELINSEAEITGKMDRAGIRRAIEQNRRAIRACYDINLQRQPDLFGKLVMQWDIEERGVARAVITKSNGLKNSEVANCVARVIGQIQFPEPPVGMVGRVTFPFVFSSR